MKTLSTLTAAIVIMLGIAADLRAQGAPPLSVTIRFVAAINGKPFACGQTYENVGLKKTAVTPADLRFFVSDVTLFNKDGEAVPVTLEQDGIWQYKNVALLDFEDGTGECRNGNSAIHEVVSGTVPPGQYVGLRFTLGVPFELDHIDPATAPSPLNMTAMLWTWQFGYKFLRAEVSPVHAPSPVAVATAARSEKADESNGFPVHLGSTGCIAPSKTSAPTQECGHPNRLVVAFPIFNVARDGVVADLGTLLKNSDVTTNTPNSAPGCMSFPDDPDCVPVMKALGLASGAESASEQTFFSREVRE